MAELTSSCCTTDTRATCCETDAKAACRDPATHAEGSCGCSAGQQCDVRETVRERYAAAARASGSGSGCGSAVVLTDRAGTQVFGDALYAGADASDATEAALSASLSCGVPTAVAELRAGETVLDLGSGAGADVLVSTHRQRACASGPASDRRLSIRLYLLSRDLSMDTISARAQARLDTALGAAGAPS